MRVGDDRKRQADPINRFHAAIERLIEESGLEWTFLRSGGIVPSSPPSRHLLFRTSSHYQYRHRPRDELGGQWAPTFPTSRCLYLHNRRLGRSGRRDPEQRRRTKMLLKDKNCVIYGAEGGWWRGRPAFRTRGGKAFP
jgi:hypothetical protein